MSEIVEQLIAETEPIAETEQDVSLKLHQPKVKVIHYKIVEGLLFLKNFSEYVEKSKFYVLEYQELETNEHKQRLFFELKDMAEWLKENTGFVHVDSYFIPKA